MWDFRLFAVVLMKIQVFWYVTKHGQVSGYGRFQGNTLSSSTRLSTQREVLFLNHLTLKMEELCASKMLTNICQSTRCNTTENLNLQANNDMKSIQIFLLFKVWSEQVISHKIYTKHWLQNLRARGQEVAPAVSHSQNIRHDTKSLWQLVNYAGK